MDQTNDDILQRRAQRQSRMASVDLTPSAQSQSHSHSQPASPKPEQQYSTTTDLKPGNYSDTFLRLKAQTRATSLPASVDGSASDGGSMRPQSLAHFIGGSSAVKGPVLNKVRPDAAVAGLEVDSKPVATFLSKNPNLLPSRASSSQASSGHTSGIALPGMARPSSSRSLPSPRTLETEVERRTEPVALPGMVKSPVSPSTSSPSSPLLVETLASEAVANEKDVLTKTQSSNTPEVRQAKANSFDQQPFSSPPTSSLTRLQGSNIVKQRLQWGEAINQQASTSSTAANGASPATTPVKHRSTNSIANRWSPQTQMVAAFPEKRRDEPETSISPSQAPTLNSPATAASPNLDHVSVYLPFSDWAKSQLLLDQPTRNRPGNPSRQSRKTKATMVSPSTQENPLPLSNVPQNIAAKTSRIQLPAQSTAPRLSTPAHAFAPRPLSQRDYGAVISTEILAISDGASTKLVEKGFVFYDQEMYAIIHRTKADGMAENRIFVWRGVQYTGQAADDRKLEALKNQYRKITIRQASVEEIQLGQMLGNRFETRSGTRKRDPDDTLLQCYKQIDGISYINEVDIRASSICTFFSYVLQIAGTLLVWHGAHSSSTQRRAAEKAVTSRLQRNTNSTLQIEEEARQSQNTGLFWQFVGADGSYAQSMLWNRCVAYKPPRIFTITAAKQASLVIEEKVQLPDDEVSLVVTCIEGFVVVPERKRGDRLAIQTALQSAQDLPTRSVHVLVFPSLVPLDLNASFLSDMDFRRLNQSFQPTRMNIRSLTEAIDEIQLTAVDQSQVEDSQCLPLGLSPDLLAVIDTQP